MHPQQCAHIVHRIPGRLRIKIPAARDQAAFFADLQRKLLRTEGITSVSVNPAAASLVIMHDRSVDPFGICRDFPELPIISPTVHPNARTNGGAATMPDHDLDFVFLLAKLLPFAFAKHPVAQLAELLAEPVLKMVVGVIVQQQADRLPDSVREPDEEPMPVAA